MVLKGPRGDILGVERLTSTRIQQGLAPGFGGGQCDGGTALWAGAFKACVCWKRQALEGFELQAGVARFEQLQAKATVRRTLGAFP